MLTLVMHLVLWLAATWLRDQPHGSGYMWIIAMVPAPMFLLAIIASSHRLSEIADSPNAFGVGVIVSAAWLVSVLTGTIVFRAVYQGWEDWGCVADMAEIASWTGIGILPFTGVIELAEVLLNYD